MKRSLKYINKILWDYENNIRKCDDGEYNDIFIKLARSIYLTNDKRTSIKREINIEMNSQIMEEKSY